MKKSLTIVVMTIPLHGHVNPMSGIVKELASKKHNVIVYTTDEFKPTVIAAGATFKSAEGFKYAHLFSPEVGKDPLKIADLILNLSEAQTESVIETIKKESPDIVLHDGFCLWAKLAAHALDIPAVSVITTIVFNPRLVTTFPQIAVQQFSHFIANGEKFWKIIRRYNALMKRFNIKTSSVFDMFINEEQQNIVFTSRYFQPYSNALPPSFQFIGPSLSARTQLEKEKYSFKTEDPLIYISLGTIFNNDPHFYHMCIEAFTDKPYNVLISVGKSVDLKVFKNLPANIAVRSHVNQISVLQKAAVFVSHGGMNSVNESMYYGVPMVLFPAVQEQQMNSLRVQQLGAGRVMKRDNLTKEKLLESVTLVATDESFKKNALEVQRSLKEAGGVSLAAKKIEALSK